MKFQYIIFLMLVVGMLGGASFALAETDTISLPNPLCPRNSAGQPINSNNCIENFPQLIAKIADYLLIVVTGIATIVLVYAGMLYLTSGGNPAKIDKAKHALIYGIAGLAIALAAKGLAEVIKGVITAGS